MFVFLWHLHASFTSLAMSTLYKNHLVLHLRFNRTTKQPVSSSNWTLAVNKLLTLKRWRLTITTKNGSQHLFILSMLKVELVSSRWLDNSYMSTCRPSPGQSQSRMTHCAKSVCLLRNHFCLVCISCLHAWSALLLSCVCWQLCLEHRRSCLLEKSVQVSHRSSSLGGLQCLYLDVDILITSWMQKFLNR